MFCVKSLLEYRGTSLRLKLIDMEITNFIIILIALLIMVGSFIIRSLSYDNYLNFLQGKDLKYNRERLSFWNYFNLEVSLANLLFALIALINNVIIKF